MLFQRYSSVLFPGFENQLPGSVQSVVTDELPGRLSDEVLKIIEILLE